jgi:hypothetical protein|tara:strand:+ start:726 stop:1337 length:612 start_codon:yes stop_codon:yes gene_type:complete
MVKYFLLLFLSFGLSTEWGTSFSVRSANDDSKPLDYELSIKLNDTDGNFKYSLKRDWERELGEKYVDDVVKIQHQPFGYLYYGVDYVNKESKDIDYTTYNIGVTVDYFKAGISFKNEDGEISPLLNLGFSTKVEIKTLENTPNISYIIGVSIKSNIVDDNIVNVKSEVKKWLTRKVNVFGLYKHEYYNKKEDFQFKVGIGVKL